MDLTGAAVTTQASAMLGGGGVHGAAGGLAGAALNAGNLNAIMGLTGNPLAAAYSANQAAVAAAGGMPNPLGAAAQLNQVHFLVQEIFYCRPPEAVNKRALFLLLLVLVTSLLF